MMKPCKCGNNKWKFAYKDELGLVVATCLTCQLQVSFIGRRQRKINAGIPIGTGLTVEFQTINGIVHRKEDGGWYEVGFIKAKGGGIKLARLAGQKQLNY